MSEPIFTRSAPRTSGAPITARAAVLGPATIDDKSRSVVATLATANPTTVWDWQRDAPIDEVLQVSGIEFPESISLLDAHQRYTIDAIRGSVRDMRVEGPALVGRVIFSEDPAGESAYQLVRAGHLREVSLGYAPIQFEELAPGETRTISGETFTAGARILRVTTRARARECSLTPVGADPNSTFRTATAPGKEPFTMPQKLRAYLETLGLRSDAAEADAWQFLATRSAAERDHASTLSDRSQWPASATATPTTTDTTRAATNATPPNVTAGTGPDLDTIRAQATADAVRAERERIASIRSLAGDDVPVAIVDRAIAEGWTTERAGVEFLGAIRSNRQPPVAGAGRGPAIHTADHSIDRRTLETACLLRANLPTIDRNAPEAQRTEQERITERAYSLRDMSMIEILREGVLATGRPCGRNTNEILERAFSTADVPNIFTTSVNAMIVQSYMGAPDSTDWVRVVDVRDFRTQDRIRLGQTSGLAKLPRGKAAKSATINDNIESYKIARYARQFSIDEQDIIDDNFGALLDMPMQMGARAGDLRPDLVYAILLANAALADGVALFHSTHGNLGTTSTALAAATLQTAITNMAKQTEDGRNLNIAPAFLMVPQDLRFTAEILMTSAQRVVASNDNGTANPLQNLLQIRADNRLGVAGVTDPNTGTTYAGTATNYFLAAAPASAPTIEVAYRSGTGRRPIVRSFTMTEGKYGIGWDVNLDIGAKALDYRGLYKATGA